MRTKLHKIVAILDGAPTGIRGQSLVEMTLVVPILLLMLMGLIEIGWFANNYLTLLDVVREAGRYGSNRDPTTWPDGAEKTYEHLDCDEITGEFNKPNEKDNTIPRGPDASYGYTDGTDGPTGYFDGVACSVLINMAPLKFNDNTDDVVVSIFSYLVINRTTAPEVKIVGRYPARANECEGDDTHDPFDWNPPNGDPTDPYENYTLYDPGFDNVRGYVFRGNHHMHYPGASMDCLGSEFSTQDVQSMLDFETDPNRTAKVARVQNGGVVLVEVFWAHYQLLALPFFRLGPLNEAQMIHVWAFFPVSAAEPNLE